MKSVGTCIRQQRKKKGLSIEKLAELADISAVFMGEIERGIKQPSLNTFINIVNALNVSSDVCLPRVQNPNKEYHYCEIAELVKDFSTKDLILVKELIKTVCNYRI